MLAYQIDPEHPRVLNYLAKYFFHKNQLSKAGNLAMQSIQTSKSPLIRAEATYIQGRIHQLEREFGLAYRDFVSVIDIWPDNSLARHGLAQMCMCLKDQSKAIDHLKILLKTKKRNVEVLKFLGSLEAKEKHNSVAIHYFEEVVLQAPEDWESWIELGQLKEQIKLSEALLCYEKAKKYQIQEIQKTKKLSKNEAKQLIPFELFNNIGSLRFREHAYDKAEKSFLDAISINTPQNSIDDFHIENITMTYNLARVYESKNESSKAISLYVGILKEFPSYIECYLRLASIAFAKNQNSIGTQWIQRAFDFGIDNIDVWSISGYSFFKERDWQKSQQQFEHILRNLSDKDLYAKIAMANIFFYASSDHKNAADRVSKYLKHSANFFKTALASQPNNLSAICGIGCILATIGHLDQAQTCFTQVRENGFSHLTLKLNAWMNLAHLHVKSKRYFHADQLYVKCLEKCFFTDKEIYLYLSNSNFCSEKLMDCKNNLLKAIHIDPQDSTLWYNLAITQIKFGDFIYRKKGAANSTLSDVYSAISSVQQAKNLFDRLLTKAKDPHFNRKYSSEVCSQEIHSCSKLLDALQSLTKELDEREKSEKARRDKFKLIEEAAAKKLRETEEEKLRIKQQQREKLALEAAAFEQENAEIFSKFSEIDKIEKKRKNKDLDMIDDSENSPPPKKKQKTRKNQKVASSASKSKSSLHELSEEEDSDDDMNYPTKMPTIDHNETIDEWRARKGGGKLNRLVEEVENETRSKRQQKIDEVRSINAGNEDNGELRDTDDEEEDDMDAELSSSEKLIKSKLIQMITNLPPEEASGFRTKQMKKNLLKAGVPKNVIVENSNFAKKIARDLLKRKPR